MKEAIKTSVSYLQKGGVILYPTDTIWGLGCSALSDKAVKRIYTLKGRKRHKACIVLVDSLEMLAQYVTYIPQKALQLIKEDFDRPFTIIYPSPKNISKSLLAEDGSIAIRVVKDGFSHDLIKAFGKPIISTSANISDSETPRNFEEITAKIKKGVDYIVDPEFDHSKGLPSKIVKFDEQGALEVIRD